MKYIPQFDQVIVIDLGLKPRHGHLLDMIVHAATWAASDSHDGETYYHLNYKKIISELPCIFKSKPTISRAVDDVEALNIVKIIYVDQELYFRPHPILSRFWLKTKKDSEKDIEEYAKLLELANIEQSSPNNTCSKNETGEEKTKNDTRSKNETVPVPKMEQTHSKNETDCSKNETTRSKNGTNKYINTYTNPSTNIHIKEDDERLEALKNEIPSRKDVDDFLVLMEWNKVVNADEFYSTMEKREWRTKKNWKITALQWVTWTMTTNSIIEEITNYISQPSGHRHWSDQLTYTVFSYTDATSWQSMAKSQIRFEVRKNYKKFKDTGEVLKMIPKPSETKTSYAAKASKSTVDDEIAEMIAIREKHLELEKKAREETEAKKEQERLKLEKLQKQLEEARA